MTVIPVQEINKNYNYWYCVNSEGYTPENSPPRKRPLSEAEREVEGSKRNGNTSSAEQDSTINNPLDHNVLDYESGDSEESSQVS